MLLKQGATELALRAAKLAVELAPSEFGHWVLLADVYRANLQFEQALLALNQAPSSPLDACEKSSAAVGPAWVRPEELAKAATNHCSQ